MIEKPGDVDSFTFHGRKGQRYDVRVFGRQIRSPLDPVLNIFAKNAGRVASNDDSEGPDSYLRFTAAQTVISWSPWPTIWRKAGRIIPIASKSAPYPRLELSTPNESLGAGPT